MELKTDQSNPFVQLTDTERAELRAALDAAMPALGRIVPMLDQHDIQFTEMSIEVKRG